MVRWRQQDVAAFAANVESHAHAAGGIAEPGDRAEVEMPAPAPGQYLGRVRQGSVEFFKGRERKVAVVTRIHVEHVAPGRGRPDVGARILRPPSLNRRRVGGGVPETIGHHGANRMLADIAVARRIAAATLLIVARPPYGKDGHAALGILEGCVQHHRCGGLHTSTTRARPDRSVYSVINRTTAGRITPR